MLVQNHLIPLNTQKTIAPQIDLIQRTGSEVGMRQFLFCQRIETVQPEKLHIRSIPSQETQIEIILVEGLYPQLKILPVTDPDRNGQGEKRFVQHKIVLLVVRRQREPDGQTVFTRDEQVDLTGIQRLYIEERKISVFIQCHSGSKIMTLIVQFIVQCFLITCFQKNPLHNQVEIM